MLFIISLLVVVVLHELAHLIVARLCKCDVEVYSLGFGPAIWKRKLRSTVVQICPILLGGYCKLKNELVYSKSHGSFSNLPYHKKVYIALAGVTINILSGTIAYYIGVTLMWYSLIYFGIVSILLGGTNLVPLAPCLDGGYVLYYPIFIKKFGYKKGTRLFKKWVDRSFKVILLLNLLSAPYIIWLILRGLI